MKKSIYDIKLNSKQLQEVLGVSHMTIFRWREKGMPFEKDGANVLFDLEKVEKWLKEEGAEPKFTFR